MLRITAGHVIGMSQQHDDDDGTVIRPPGPAAAVSLPVTSPGPVTPPGQGRESGPPDSAEDGLSLRIGTRVSEFEITQRIGDGGFSIVYLAMDHSLERTVALKEYMPSSLATRVGTTLVQPRSSRYRDTFEAGLRSFVNEAKLLAQFDHPALVKVYRFWEANGTAYMVMPFYQGMTVKQAVRAMPAPPDEAWLLALLAPLTEALRVIHAERCYHRDIAPDNVILLASTGKPLLLDFGAARRVIGDMTQGLTVILKAGYAPVEQYAEIPGMKQGAWTDVYALGAVVYWIITGNTPPASVGRMMSDSFVPLARCAAGRYSTGFLEAIDRTLLVRPEHRTQSIEVLRRELGLTGQEALGPVPAWNDSDATVIRPAGHEPRPSTPVHRQATDISVARPSTAQPLPVAPFQPPPVAEAQPGSATVQSLQPPPRETAPRPQQGEGGEAGTRVSRRVVLAASALGVAVAAAGIWWAVQAPSAESSRAVPEGASASAPDPRPAVSEQAKETPAVAAPVAEVQPGPPSPAVTPAPTGPVGEAGAPKPDEVANTAPVESTPDTPPRGSTDKPAAPDTIVAPPAQNVERAAKRVDVAKPERAQADATNQAECGRIFQRLSLGESSPELLNRLKSLKCK
ncbi:MAG: serine/threonine protein kinase [Burkholderiaceae bacterium]